MLLNTAPLTKWKISQENQPPKRKSIFWCSVLNLQFCKDGAPTFLEYVEQLFPKQTWEGCCWYIYLNCIALEIRFVYKELHFPVKLIICYSSACPVLPFHWFLLISCLFIGSYYFTQIPHDPRGKQSLAFEIWYHVSKNCCTFFLIGIHSMQNWTNTRRQGVQGKKDYKDKNHTGKHTANHTKIKTIQGSRLERTQK